MVTNEQLDELYAKAKYREVIAAVNVEELNPGSLKDEEKLLRVGWAYHQLGEYDKSVPIMGTLILRHVSASEIGESARRGLAHGTLQRYGDIEGADRVLQEIPPSLARDNVRMNLFLTAARKGIEIPVSEVMQMIVDTMMRVPYEVVNGHIVNNGTFTLHEARNQEGVHPYVSILPGFIEAAIGIYEAVGAAKNHLAGALYRASLIFEATGPEWLRGAREMIGNSVRLWRELVEAQGGERFQKNLDGALAQLEKLTKPNQ